MLPHLFERGRFHDRHILEQRGAVLFADAEHVAHHGHHRGVVERIGAAEAGAPLALHHVEEPHRLPAARQHGHRLGRVEVVIGEAEKRICLALLFIAADVNQRDGGGRQFFTRLSDSARR